MYGNCRFRPLEARSLIRAMMKMNNKNETSIHSNSSLPEMRTFELVSADAASTLGVTGSSFFLDRRSFTSGVGIVFFGDSSGSVLTVSSNVALLSSVVIAGGGIRLRRPLCKRVLITRARPPAPRRPLARRAVFRGKPRPETAAVPSACSSSFSSSSSSPSWSPFSTIGVDSVSTTAVK